MKKIFLVLSLQIIWSVNYAQPYMDGGNTRHRFAQLNVGFEHRLFLGSNPSSFTFNTNGSIEQFKLPNHNEARVILGGTHFWGHADFYISIPVYRFGNSGFQARVETGAKYFPWRIQSNKIRPYLGAAWLPVSYQQENGVTIIRSRMPMNAGVVYNFNNHLFEVGAGYFWDNRIDYFISETRQVTVSAKQTWLALSYKLMIETTLSAEKDWASGRTRFLTDTLAKLNRLNGFTIALGVSSSFFLKPSLYLAQIAPYADNHKSASIFPEFGIGYYFHRPDIHLNVAYRSITSKINAFQFSQQINRKALTFEAYKFFTDYHGFAPFIGASISQEWLTVQESLLNNPFTFKEKGLHPGLTFGWDIRPNRIQTWYLRTNLRYFPTLKVTMPNEQSHNLGQLEFNFIQLVLFPGRF